MTLSSRLSRVFGRKAKSEEQSYRSAAEPQRSSQAQEPQPAVAAVVSSATDGEEDDKPGADARMALLSSATKDEDDRFGANMLTAPLLSAIHGDRVDDAKQMIAAGGAFLEERNAIGSTPLMFAASRGNLELVELLLARGASVFEKNSLGLLPLFFAAEGRSAKIVGALIDDDCTLVDESDNGGNTALFFAARQGIVDTVELLLRRGASVNSANDDGRTPLFFAAKAGSDEITELLLEKGAMLNWTDVMGETALFNAVRKGHASVVRTLLDRGTKVDEENRTMITPMLYAVQKGRTQIVRDLLAYRADVNLAALESPLLYAARMGNAPIVRILLENGASIQKTDLKGWSAACYATLSKHKNLIQADRASLNVFETYDTANVDVENLKRKDYIMRRNEAMIEGRDNARTVLGSAVAMSYYSASPTEDGVFNRTTLHEAAKTGDASTVEDLVGRGASMNGKDAAGLTPIFLAAKNGHAAVVELLLDGGVDVYCADFGDNNPLLAAGRAGFVDVVKLLVTAGASVNCRGEDGETPLISAARWDYVAGARLLIENGGSIGRRATLTTGEADEDTPLIPETLRSMSALCTRVAALREMGMRVLERLAAICFQLQQQDDANRIDDEILVEFATIVFRVCQLLLKCEGQSPVTRLLGIRARAEQLADIHEAIDHFVLYSMNGDEEAASSDWCGQLEKDREQQMRSFQAWSQDDLLLVDCLFERADRVEALRLLQYEVAKHSEVYSSDTLLLISRITERLEQLNGGDAAVVPAWFISRDDIEFHDWNRMGDRASFISATKFHGTWMKTPVMIITTSDLTHVEFEERALRWYQLSHPHVIELYGACHASEPFIFATEFSTMGTIRSFLNSGEGFRLILWQKMYEVALGLQYLHERTIIHGELRCENIVVSNDLVAKVAGFGESSSSGSATNSASLRWKAPELLQGGRPSFASDVYTLGMCIVEAVTDEAPWTAQTNIDAHVVRYVRLGLIPRRPRAMSDSQWALVRAMCDSDPTKRVKVGFVVNELEKLAEEECGAHHAQKYKSCAFCSSASKHLAATDNAWASSDRIQQDDLASTLENCFVASLGGSIHDTLHRMRQKLGLFPDSQQAAEQVLDRLARVPLILQQHGRAVHDAEVAKYCAILARFQRYLRTPLSENSVARYARSRKVADSNHIFHSDIDRLLDILNVYDGNSIRDWRDQLGASSQSVQQHQSSVAASVAGTGDERKHGGVTLVYKNASSGAGQQSTSCAPAAQPWYLPLRELVFTETDCIGEGSFGAVYRGVWLNTSVVVKFMGYKEDIGKVSTQLLLHEVAIWHRLSHPHVVKLFGACHIDKRYFVCEYAPNGTLSEFLRRSGTAAARAPPTWQKLYEASLGLQYLHGVNVVHNDLKCDNILVGADGKAKLTDFGLSSIPNEVEVRVDVARTGAVHWKSPEYLAGQPPTFATDIYSFAMCMLEAVTGDIPWGRQMAGAVVKFRVKRGQIPLFPDAMNEKQRRLVQLMTASDPLRRAKVGFVADKLMEIARDEAAAAAVMRTASAPSRQQADHTLDLLGSKAVFI